MTWTKFRQPPGERAGPTAIAARVARVCTCRIIFWDNCHTPLASSQPVSRSHPRHPQCLCTASPACEAVQRLGGKAYVPASGTRLTTPHPLPETSAPTFQRARSLFSSPCSLRLTHSALLAWDPLSPSCCPTQPTPTALPRGWGRTQSPGRHPGPQPASSARLPGNWVSSADP